MATGWLWSAISRDVLGSRLRAVEDEFARFEKERCTGKATLERDDCIEEAVSRASMQHQLHTRKLGNDGGGVHP